MVVNPLLIPSRTRTAVKRGFLVMTIGILGPWLMESQAAVRPGSESQAPAPVTRQSTPAQTSPRVSVPEGRLVLLPPGTVVETKAPAGWSHLLLKSLPRIHPEHRGLVSESTYRLSGLVFTAMAVRVEPLEGSQPPRYYLGDVGLGLGTKVRGQDVVLSPETQARLGANLGFQERILLSECYKKQQLARSVVRTDTMAVFDTHAVMIRGQQHRLARMRYAILLDPRSGQIATLAWGMDVDQQGRPLAANTPLEWLPPNKVDDCVLHVDPRQITFGIPNDLAFAVNGAPQGQREIPLTTDLARLSSQPSYVPQTAKSLETLLRNELAKVIQQAAQQESASRIAGGSGPR